MDEASISSQPEHETSSVTAWSHLRHSFPAKQMARYDLILYGAGGFTGQLAVEYLAKQQARGRLSPEIRWAIGGRDEAKLQRVRARCCEAHGISSVGIVTADALQRESLDANISSQARTVLSFAGPYDSQYGRNLVDSCVASNTDYVDITGELTFMRRSVHTHHDTATQGGSVIVHNAGFDSVPADISSYVASKAAASASPDGVCTSVECLVGPAGGGAVSGGTLESAAGQLNASVGPLNMYAPEAADGPARNTSIQTSARYSVNAQTWTAAAPNAPVDARVFLRSSYLLPHVYSPKCSFTQSIPIGSYAAAAIATKGLSALTGVVSSQQSRRLLQNAGLLNKQGEGPSERQRAAGYFNVYAFAEAPVSSNRHTRYLCHFGATPAHLYYTADPGYSGAAAMSVLAAITLVQQRQKCAPGGVHTPSSALGDAYVAKLLEAGFTVACAPWERTAPLPLVSNNQ